MFDLALKYLSHPENVHLCAEWMSEIYLYVGRPRTTHALHQCANSCVFLVNLVYDKHEISQRVWELDRSISPKEVLVAYGAHVSPSGAAAVCHLNMSLGCAVRVRDSLRR